MKVQKLNVRKVAMKGIAKGVLAVAQMGAGAASWWGIYQMNTPKALQK